MSTRLDQAATGTVSEPRRFQVLWLQTRRQAPLLGFALVAVLIELFYFYFMVSRGMLDKQVQVSIGGWSAPFSIAVGLALGNAALLVSLWHTVFLKTAYVGLGSDRRTRRIIYVLRGLRLSALIIASFTIILFLPYILESNWYLGFAIGVGDSLPALRDPILGFYEWAYGISRTDGSIRFIASQLVASLGTILVMGLYLWRVRSTRGLPTVVRRRRVR